jgi:hypothetical protein
MTAKALHSSDAPDADTGKPRRRADAIDAPARPLGAKCAALQSRRRRAIAALTPGPTRCNDNGAMCLRSATSPVRLVLRTSPVGLFVERSQSRELGHSLTQCMVFADPGTFDRWCAIEPLRFEDPMLHGQLVRHGHDVLDSPPSSR